MPSRGPGPRASHMIREDGTISQVTHSHLEHFSNAGHHYRALQLPDGLMLRCTLCQSLYFYLRTGVEDAKVVTRVYASDSPYDLQKTNIGEVSTAILDFSTELH